MNKKLYRYRMYHRFSSCTRTGFFVLILTILSIGLIFSYTPGNNKLSVSEFTIEPNSSNTTELYQTLEEAMHYQKLQDFASAIRLYEKVLLTLDSSIPTEAISVKEQEELWKVFGSSSELVKSSSTLLLPLVHYNFAHALYQYYLNTLMQSTSTQLHTDEVNQNTDISSYLTRAIYYYAQIIHTPPYSSAYSPLLIELSSNNLTAIQQRHRIPAFTPEPSIIERIRLPLMPTPHLLGVSFLFILTLGMIWGFLQNKYPQPSYPLKNKENFFHNGFKQLQKLGRWKNIFNKTVDSSETSGFYLSGYDYNFANTTLPSKEPSALSRSPYLTGSLANQSPEPVPPLIKRVIKIIKTWFFIGLIIYAGLGLLLWHASSGFLTNSANNFKSFLLNFTTDTPTVTIPNDAIFNKLAVVRAQTPLRDNPVASTRPLASLIPGEIVGINSATSTPNTLKTIWQPVKTANGVIGWVSREQLLFVKTKD